MRAALVGLLGCAAAAFLAAASPADGEPASSVDDAENSSSIIESESQRQSMINNDFKDADADGCT